MDVILHASLLFSAFLRTLFGMEKIRAAAARVRSGYRALAEHKYTTIAGTLVFFLIISVVPFVFWLTLILGSTPVADALLELELFDWARDLIIYIKGNAEGATRGAGIFFLATTLWSSSGFFYHLRRSGEIVYRCDRTQHGFRVRLSAILFTIAVLLYLAAAATLLFAVLVYGMVLPRILAHLCTYAMLAVLGFFAAWLLNAYICPYRVSPADTAPGSLFTAGLWLAASFAFSVFLRFSDREKLYGALSLVVVSMLFCYWLMICFTAGAIFNCRRLQGKAQVHRRL